MPQSEDLSSKTVINKKAKHQNKLTIHIEDLPNEVLLKVFSFMDIKDLICFGGLSKRIRGICHDSSLWQKVNLNWKQVPAQFLKLILKNKCKYLKLSNPFGLAVKGRLLSKKTSQLWSLYLGNNCKIPNKTKKESLGDLGESYSFLTNSGTSTIAAPLPSVPPNGNGRRLGIFYKL